MKRRSTVAFGVCLLGLATLLSGCEFDEEKIAVGGGGGGGGIGRNFTLGTLTGTSSIDPSNQITRSANNINAVGLMGQFTNLSLSTPTRVREIGKIVYSISMNQQATGLHVGAINADGSGSTDLTPGSAPDYYYPRFTPTADVFVTQQSGKLFRFNANGSGKTALNNPDSFSTLTDYQWSPDGNRLVFTEYNGNLNTAPNRIAAINKDGTGYANLSTPGALQDRNPAYSPDAQKIAFVRNPIFGSSGTSSLMHMNPDGTGQASILNVTNERLGSPSWSPNSETLVFSRNGAIWSISKSGGTPTKLTNPAAGENDGNPIWAPHTALVAYRHAAPRVGGGFNFQLKIMSPTGTVVASKDNAQAFSWSPDGARIAYDGGGIFVMNADGSNVVTLQTGQVFAPHWANPIRSNRNLVGTGAEMADSARGFGYGASDGRAVGAPTSLFVFNSTSAPSELSFTLPPDMNTGNNIAYKIEGKTTSVTLSNLVYWNLFLNDPVGLGGGHSGAIVTLGSGGEIASVAPYNVLERTAAVASSTPKGAMESGMLVIKGTFKGVWDKNGKNIAPQGATEIRYDSQGRIVSVR